MNGYESYYDDAEQEAYPLVRAMLGEGYDEAGPEEIERLFYDLYGEEFTPQDITSGQDRNRFRPHKHPI